MNQHNELINQENSNLQHDNDGDSQKSYKFFISGNLISRHENSREEQQNASLLAFKYLGVASRPARRRVDYGLSWTWEASQRSMSGKHEQATNPLARHSTVIAPILLQNSRSKPLSVNEFYAQILSLPFRSINKFFRQTIRRYARRRQNTLLKINLEANYYFF